MREFLLSRTAGLLQKKGFRIGSFIHSNTCFDFIAKSGAMTLLVKVFGNIDAIRQEQAEELKRIAVMLDANAVVVGEKTKVFALENGTAYERYGLPAINLKTFSDALEEKTIGSKYFKGKEVVGIDAEKMKKRMAALGLTSGELAERSGSSRESIYRYEKGEAASLETAQKLEKALGTNVIKGVRLFEKPLQKKDYPFDREFGDEALSKIHDLGFNLAVFEHAPFKAYSELDSPLLISRGMHRQEMRKRAEELKKANSIVKSDSFIVAKEFGKKTIDDVPVVDEEELDSFSSAKDLVKEVRERGKNERKRI